MGIALTSIGVKVSYCAETTAGTRPSANYIKLPDIKSIPDFNPQPNTADATTLDNLTYTTYVTLLKDIGGAIEFNANLTSALYTAWEGDSSASPAVAGLMGTYETAKASGKKTYFCIDIPNFKAIYFAVEPSHIGLASADANSLLETTLYVTPITEPEFSTAPTYAS